MCKNEHLHTKNNIPSAFCFGVQLLIYNFAQQNLIKKYTLWIG